MVIVIFETAAQKKPEVVSFYHSRKLLKHDVLFLPTLRLSEHALGDEM